MAKASIQQDHGGYFVEWYRDSDGDSGYGESPEVCRWYGTRAECEARMTQPVRGRGVSPATRWQPVGADSSNDRYWGSLYENARI